MVKVKICGITSLNDALAAIEAGADMLGFNFYRPSPRFIEPEHASQIIDRVRRDAPSVKLVGVFVNEDLDNLLLTVSLFGIDMVQLHGDESPDMCRELSGRLELADDPGAGIVKSFRGENYPAAEIIKALRVTDDFDVSDTTRYAVDAIMLDAFHQTLRGGTGKTIDWDIARAAAARVERLFLSGGLSPENVAEAIARVRPFAVDACSSLEAAPGRKDASRMRAFVRAAHQV